MNAIDIIIKAKDMASNTIDSVSNSVNKLSSHFAAATAASKQFALAYVAAGVGIAGLIGFGAKVAGDLEAARMGFITLLGSAEKADETLAMIKKDAAKTPFELPGLIQANQMLTSVTKDGKESEKILMNVGKALSAMGRGQPELDRIIVNLQQIGAVGHASMIDIKQFAFAGIPIFDMLTKATGKTGDALSDMISNGEVTFSMITEMFNKAGSAGGQFADAFKNQAGTFNQLWSNMKDTVTVAAATIIQKTGIFDMLKKALSSIIDYLNQHQDDIINWVKRFTEFIKKNFPIIAAIIIGTLIPAVISLIATIGSAVIALAPFVAIAIVVGLVAKKLADRLGGWDKLFEAVTGKIRTFVLGIKAFVSAFKEGDVTSDGFVGKMERFGEILHNLWAKMKPIVMWIKDKFVEAFKSLWDAISKDLLPALKRIMPFLKIIGAILLVIVGISFAIMIASVWLFVKALTFVIKVISAIINFLSDVTRVARDVWNKVSEWAVAAWNGIKKAFNSVKNWLIGAFNTVKNAAMSVWNGIKNAALTVWNAILTVITPIINVIATTIKIIYNVAYYVFTWIRGIAILVWNFIWSNVIQPVINFIVGYFNFMKETWSTILNAIVAVATTIWNWIYDNIIKPVVDKIMLIFNTLKDWFTTAWTWIKDKAITAWDTIKEKITGIVDKVKSVWNGIVDWFKDKWNKIKEGAGAIKDGIVNAVTGAFDTAKNTVKNGINWIIDKINKIIGGVNKVASKVPGVGEIPTIPKLALGTSYARGGIFQLGEHGTEEAILPRGTKVRSADETKVAGSGGGNTFTGDIVLGDSTAVKEFFRQLDRDGELSGMGVAI